MSAANWEAGVLPGVGDPADSAVIGDGAGIGGIAIVDSAVPTLDRWLLGGTTPGASGNIDILDGGTLRTSGVSANSIGLNGTGQLTVSGGLVSMAGRLDINDGRVVQAGGRVEIGESKTSGHLQMGIDHTARYDIAGGELDVAGKARIGFPFASHFTQTGGTVRVRDELLVGIAAGSGSYTISGGELAADTALVLGRAGGAGQLNILGDDATITVGTFEAPTGSTLDLGIDAGITRVAVATPPVLGGDLAVGFSETPTAGAMFPIFAVAGSDPTTSRFAGKDEGAVFGATWPGGTARVQITYQGNADGGAIANDMVLTVLSASTLVGDVNLDGVVDAADLGALTRNLGQMTGAILTDGDANGDGRVSLLDVLTVRQHLGDDQITPVPEPRIATLSALLLIVLVIFGRVCPGSRGGALKMIVGGIAESDVTV